MTDPSERTRGDFKDRGLTALMDGRFKGAIALYDKHMRLQPDDNLARLELACAHSAARHPLEFESIANRFRHPSVPPKEEARLRTGQAFFDLRVDPAADVRGALEEATRLDTSFPLAHFSLGRHLLWRTKDRSLAKHHLRIAAELAPESRGAGLGVVAAEVEDGNFGQAAKLSRALVRVFPLSGRVWLALALTSLLSTPVNGRLLLLLAGVLLFIRGLGPAMLIASALIAGISLISLRRVSPRLAIFPAIALVGLSAVYVLRGIVLGRVYP